MIHPTAIISEKAKIGKNVIIGPNTLIEDDVIVGDNCEIKNNVVLANGARIGNNVKIFTGAVISAAPQDLKYNNEPTKAIIGDDTEIREYATINRGTTATNETRVGKNCLIMTYCHVAHDCILGDNIIMSNGCQLGGHVEIEDWVGLGGVVLVHQFSKIGKHSFIGAGMKIVKDCPPFILTGKVPIKIEGINKIGLKRRGFSDDTIKKIDQFYRDLTRSGKTTQQIYDKYESDDSLISEIKDCIDFIKSSQRGIYR